MIKRIVFAGALLVAPLVVQAEQPPQYWGLSVGQFELEDEDQNITDTTDIGLKGGYRFSRFLALELQGGWESGSTSGALDQPNIRYAGAYARFDLPLEGVNVYLLAGGAGVEYDRGQDNETQSGASGGVGIELYGNERTAVLFEYMNYAEGAYEGVRLGIVHHFNWPRLRQ